MADMMQVDLVSPEKRLASIEAEAVMLPGTDGDFTAMPGHVPLATALRAGMISIRSGSNETLYVVDGGFAEVSGAGVSVLAERIAKREDATADMFAGSLAAAEAALEDATNETRAEARRAVDTIRGMMDQLS